MSGDPCFAQVEQGPWKRYRTDNDQFSVTLPTLPALTTNLIWRPDLNKRRQERELGAYADGVAYSISTFENLEAETLESFVRGINKKAGDTSWNLNSLRRLTVDNVNGLQRVTPLDVEGMVQYFVTSERLYRFGALGAAPDDPRVAQFFSSITFSKNPEGTLVVDGPGELWRLPNTDANPELNKAFVGKEVTRKARLMSKPEPVYTETARRNGIAGTVVLKVIFSREGAVEGIRIVSELPDGLTENAIAVAKRIKFVPAVKDGRFVSMWIQLEYNFNLY
jgi:TonB family protein